MSSYYLVQNKQCYIIHKQEKYEFNIIYSSHVVYITY